MLSNMNKITTILKDENKSDVERFVSYVTKMRTEKDKKGKLKNYFMSSISDEKLASLFLRVKEDGLVFDGKHVTLGRNGISYDYIAYKNKMILAYPETKFDLSVVKEGDTFEVSKDDGSVNYKHTISDPLQDSTPANIIGAYCVIKNSRGEFITLLSKEEIARHRGVAKTDYIWKAWFKEMVLKTIIKKACKYHFDDVYEKMEETDNVNYDLENAEISKVDGLKDKIAEAKTQAELLAIYTEHEGLGQELTALLTQRKEEIKAEK